MLNTAMAFSPRDKTPSRKSQEGGQLSQTHQQQQQQQHQFLNQTINTAAREVKQRCRLSNLSMLNLLGLIDFAYIVVQLKLKGNLAEAIKLCYNSLHSLTSIN
jgi:hypothetical protein